MIKRISAAIVLAFMGFCAQAQTTIGTQPASNDLMRSNGKILVVVAVILIIMIGFFSYLISVDRKITKLEKENK